MEESKKLTTASGQSFAENENPMSVGPHGPLVQDYNLHEKMAHGNRERVSERAVHANRSGAYGTFTVTHDISAYTRARLFNEVGRQTKLFARFSTVGSEKGSANTERNPREFAVTFYTEDGNWDLVGSNTPVSFTKDSKNSGDFSQKHDLYTNYGSATVQWDYWSLNPESLHQLTILMSDRGVPYGCRHMNGYGSHTFSFINADGERFWVKFHFKTAQGIKNFSNAEAAEMSPNDLDFSQRDLREAIGNGEFPRWNLKVQVMPETDAKTYGYNPFDLTKVWPHAAYPLIDVGVMELNENPDKHFVRVEQSAFSSAYLVDGIGYPPDNVDGAADILENDHYSQPGNLYRNVMTVGQRRLLIANIVGAMSGISGPTRDRIINLQLCHWFRVDLTLGMAVAQGLGVDMASLSSMMGHHRQAY